MHCRDWVSQKPDFFLWYSVWLLQFTGEFKHNLANFIFHSYFCLSIEEILPFIYFKVKYCLVFFFLNVCYKTVSILYNRHVNIHAILLTVQYMDKRICQLPLIIEFRRFYQIICYGYMKCSTWPGSLHLLTTVMPNLLSWRAQRHQFISKCIYIATFHTRNIKQW